MHVNDHKRSDVKSCKMCAISLDSGALRLVRSLIGRTRGLKSRQERDSKWSSTPFFLRTSHRINHATTQIHRSCSTPVCFMIRASLIRRTRLQILVIKEFGSFFLLDVERTILYDNADPPLALRLQPIISVHSDGDRRRRPMCTDGIVLVGDRTVVLGRGR